MQPKAICDPPNKRRRRAAPVQLLAIAFREPLPHFSRTLPHVSLAPRLFTFVSTNKGSLYFLISPPSFLSQPKSRVVTYGGLVGFEPGQFGGSFSQIESVVV